MTQVPETEEAIFFKLGERVKMPAGKIVLEYALDRLQVPREENTEQPDIQPGEPTQPGEPAFCEAGADVLILDEPTRNFSPLSGPVIRSMLREY